jgi:hypothetical protein
MNTGYVNYQVNFNSKDRINTIDPPNKATFKITDLINLNSRKRAYLSMPYVNIPPTWYNVSAQNNSIIINESTWPVIATLTYTVTIPKGNYNISTFITALTTAMTAQSALFGYALTYGGSYNAGTGQMTLFINPADPTHTFTYTFSDTLNSDLKAFMGFDKSWNSFTLPYPLNQVPPQANSYTNISPNQVNFSSSVPAVYVRCSIFKFDSCYDSSAGSEGDGATGNILQIVPIEGNGFSQIILNGGYEGLENKRVEVSNILNSNITFTLTSDDPNYLVDIGNWDWQGVMMIHYSRENKESR